MARAQGLPSVLEAKLSRRQWKGLSGFRGPISSQKCSPQQHTDTLTLVNEGMMIPKGACRYRVVVACSSCLWGYIEPWLTFESLMLWNLLKTFKNAIPILFCNVWFGT